MVSGPNQRIRSRVRLEMSVRIRQIGPPRNLIEVARTLDVSRNGLLFRTREPYNLRSIVWVTFPYNADSLVAEPEAPATVVRRMVAETQRVLGPIDVLVNNAGIYIEKPAVAFTEREYDAVMDINLKGAWLCSKYALPGMVRRKRGAIVLVSSDSGLVGTAGSSVYCASKAGMILLARCMALEHAADGIRVNSICPGEVVTPMMERDAVRSGRGFEGYYKWLTAPIPMRRAGRPEEIARAILFLASDDASFMTGAELVVDGGYSAK